MLIPTTDPEVVYSPTVIVDETKKNESKFKMPFKVKAPQIKALQPPDRTVIMSLKKFFFFFFFFFFLNDR